MQRTSTVMGPPESAPPAAAPVTLTANNVYTLRKGGARPVPLRDRIPPPMLSLLRRVYNRLR